MEYYEHPSYDVIFNIIKQHLNGNISIEIAFNKIMDIEEGLFVALMVLAWDKEKLNEFASMDKINFTHRIFIDIWHDFHGGKRFRGIE